MEGPMSSHAGVFPTCLLALHIAAPIDIHHHACYIGGHRRAQKEDSGGDFLRASGTAQRYVGLGLRFMLGAQNIRFDDAGRNGIA